MGYVSQGKMMKPNDSDLATQPAVGGDQHQVERLRAVLNICRRMSAMTDLASLQSLITQEAKELLQADRVSIFLFDRDNCELWSAISQEGQIMRFDARLGIAGAVAMSGQAINVADAYEHPLFYKEVDLETGYRTQNLLAVPLHSLDGAVIGVGEATNKRGGVFTDDDAEILATLAARVADIIETSPIAAELKAHRIWNGRLPAPQLINGFSTQNIVGMSHRIQLDHPAHRSDPAELRGCAYPRGKRHRQRADCQGSALQQPAGASSVRRGQLRGAAGKSARDRIVRH